MEGAYGKEATSVGTRCGLGMCEIKLVRESFRNVRPAYVGLDYVRVVKMW
jgi:hypothetical protein